MLGGLVAEPFADIEGALILACGRVGLFVGVGPLGRILTICANRACSHALACESEEVSAQGRRAQGMPSPGRWSMSPPRQLPGEDAFGA